MVRAYYNDTLAIDSLLSAGSRVNERERKFGWTALQVAVMKGNHNVVKHLLKQSVDPNLCDFSGYTPLMEACLFDNFSIAQTLLKYGANPNIRLKNGWSALMGATSFAEVRVVELLLKNRAKVNAKRTVDGITALQLAKDPGKRQLLLQYGAK